MPDQKTKADSLREYFTGASSDNGSQSNASLSLGNYRSSTEATSMGITIDTSLSRVTVLFAGGANPTGSGTITAVDSNHLQWKPPGSNTSGDPVSFGTNETKILEANGTPAQFIRVFGNAPFTMGTSNITLSYLYNNFFGFGEVSIEDAATGVSQYRASIIRNESGQMVTDLKRYIGTLASTQISTSNWLSSSGSGSIVISGSFADWPSSGWCHIQTSGGITKEIVYYTSRTNTALTVPASGRGLLGTTPTAGSNTDKLYSVPGVAVGKDPAGTQMQGSSIQTIANETTPPANVTWKTGITENTGLQIGNLNGSAQVGVWLWRQIPAGAKATPGAVTKLLDSFNAF